MKLKYVKSVISSSGGGLRRIGSASWSPNNSKLAIATADKTIMLFDDSGELKDKFATKAVDGQANYRIVDICYSPDSTKLAVAQSDKVVLVYKLGLEWGEKKTICNKFLVDQEITCLSWPKQLPAALIFGTIDGKVRIGNLKTNKANTLFETGAIPVCLASNLDGSCILSGHSDGSVFRFYLSDMNSAMHGQIISHRCFPNAICWAESTIIIMGIDKKVIVYNEEGINFLGNNIEGKAIQQFDYYGNENVYEITCGTLSQSGQSMLLGSFNLLISFSFDSSSQSWLETEMKQLKNFYGTTVISWKPDGSKVCIGSMCGEAAIFECALRKVLYKNKFEFIYTSPSQVVIKRLSTGSKIVLKSQYGYQIQNINVYKDQFIIAKTTQTLLCGDMKSCKLSEVPWSFNSGERYYFDIPNACLIQASGEIAVVEYPFSKDIFIIGVCRTEKMNPRLLSIRISERDSNIRRIVAFLADPQTIHVQDLTSGNLIHSVEHNTKIDWLELSGKANKLLFRDKRKQLILENLEIGEKNVLLNYCTYVQWVPDSDVIVAQSHQTLNIWYNGNHTSQITCIPIKGDVETIERINGITQVIVDEGMNTVAYTLNEALIEFGSSIEDKNFQRAIAILESLDEGSEVDTMWKTLGDMALKEKRLAVAERCFAAIGQVCLSSYLHSINEIIRNLIKNGEDMETALNDYAVKAKLAVMNHQFQVAEAIYLDQGKTGDAMEMYQELHKWDLAIRVAEIRNHPDLKSLKEGYFAWLLESNQEDKAAEIKEKEGDFVNAIQLYLKGGLPGKAAVLLNQYQDDVDEGMAERIASSLFKAGLYEKAGDFFEGIMQNQKALEAYKKGKSYRKAIELSRKVNPTEVIALEEQWGDYLVSIKQLDAATNHYIEANRPIKAAEAAINAKQWKKASSIVDSIHPIELAKPFHMQLAAKYKEIQDFVCAERHFLQAGRPDEAMNMYFVSREWKSAYNVANSAFTNEETNFRFINEARKQESEGDLKEAEKIYLVIREPDLAINMYKNNKDYENMMRLVSIHHKDLVNETHIFLAKGLESELNYAQSEFHYVQAGDWKAALNMYCSANNFEEAYRVAKTYGKDHAVKQVAYLWARSVGGESAAKLLTKMGLIDSAIDFASENGAFDFAFELCHFADSQKELDVHYKQAMFFEDEGKFKEAELGFIKSGRPREAILMYIHNQDWQGAQKVAEKHDPGSLSEILMAQTKLYFEKKDFASAEACALKAQKPELILSLYKNGELWQDAIRFASDHLQAKLGSIKADYDLYLQRNGQIHVPVGDFMGTAKILEQKQEYSHAIDAYLKINVSQSTNLTVLEKAWDKALALTFKFVPQRTKEVVNVIANRYIELNRFDFAGELFSNAELYEEAIKSYIQGGHWDDARKTASNYMPQLKSYVESAYVKSLKESGDTEKLVQMDSAAALSVLANNGEWERCLGIAKGTQNSEMINQYLALFVNDLVLKKQFTKAIEVIVNCGCPKDNSLIRVYVNLCQEVLNNQGDYSKAKSLLLSLNEQNKLLPEELDRYLTIFHLLSMKIQCLAKPELIHLAYKQALSLLRYPDHLPSNQLFFEAGQLCQKSNQLALAFLAMNRFLDIEDAIEDGQSTVPESDQSGETDFPVVLKTPAKPFSEDEREKVREWVLSLSLEPSFDQTIPKSSCEACSGPKYVGALICADCQHSSSFCCVTGFPVHEQQKSACSICNQVANREDWNTFVSVMKVCPWCSGPASQSFSMK